MGFFSSSCIWRLRGIKIPYFPARVAWLFYVDERTASCGKHKKGEPLSDLSLSLSFFNVIYRNDFFNRQFITWENNLKG